MKLVFLLLLIVQVGLAQQSNSAKDYNKLAKQASHSKNYQQAISYFQKEKALYSTQNISSDLAKCSYNLATLYRIAANYPKAIKESNQTIKYCQQLYGKKHKETLDAHVLHIKNLYTNYQLKATHQEIKQTLQTFQDSLIKYPNTKHNLLVLDANVLTEQGQYLEAEQLLETLSKTTTNHKTLATIYNNIGTLKEYQQLNQQALQYYIQVLEIKEQLYTAKHPELAIIYHNLGIINFKLANFAEAQKWFEQCYSINQQHYGKEHDQSAKDLSNLGSIYYEQGLLDKAKDYFLQEIDIYTKIWKGKTIKLSIPLQKLAHLEYSKQNYTQALDYHTQTLNLVQHFHKKDHPDILKVYINIGKTYQQQGQYSKAISIYQEALKNIKTYSFWSLKITEQLLFCLSSQQDYKQIYLLLPSALSQIQTLNNKWKQDIDQQQFLELIAHICEYGLSSCWELYQQDIQSNYLELALALIECNKALSLTKIWQDRQWSQQLGITDSIFQSSHQLAVQINHWEQQWSNAQNEKDSLFSHYCSQQLFSLQQQLDSLEKLPKFPKWKQPTTTIDLGSLQKGLAANNALLNYFYGQQAIYCLSLSKDSVKFVKIAIDSNFQSTFTHYLNLLQDLNLAKENLALACQKYQKQSFALYKQLVEPCIVGVAIQQLLISPDGLLYYLPFAALTNKIVPDARSFHQLSYCLQAFSISYIHSAQLWNWQSQHKPSKSSSILGLAPLDYQIQLDSIAINLPKLPATQKELAYLQGRFAGQFEQSSLDIQQAFEQHSILHLATHAWADKQNPLNAYLVVGNQQVLHTYQLAQFSLKADLVVLSACETGLGKIQKGEGILSIARGFIYAGAPSIALTLWTVNDQSSYELTTQFYEALARSQNKAEAIQAAQKHYISNNSAFRTHPFFWAAYQVWGDVQPLKLRTKKTNNSYWIIIGCLGLLLVGVYYMKHKKSLFD